MPFFATPWSCSFIFCQHWSVLQLDAFSLFLKIVLSYDNTYFLHLFIFGLNIEQSADLFLCVCLHSWTFLSIFQLVCRPDFSWRGRKSTPTQRVWSLPRQRERECSRRVFHVRQVQDNHSPSGELGLYLVHTFLHHRAFSAKENRLY